MRSHNMISHKNAKTDTQRHAVTDTFLEFDCELLQGIGFEGDEHKVVNIVSDRLYKRVEYIPGSSIAFVRALNLLVQPNTTTISS